MNRLTALALAATTSVATVVTILWLRSKRKTDEQQERERRLRISAAGRITDGTVLDAQEMQVNDKPAQLVIYQYDVGGVSYEASQDITHLRQFIDLHTCRIGLPTSVKYDPQNPANSIVIAEGWVGLRM
jgi:hypothetical protein